MLEYCACFKLFYACGTEDIDLKENPTFSLQSVDEIMKIVEEAKVAPRVSRSIGGFGWGGEEDGDAKEEDAEEDAEA